MSGETYFIGVDVGTGSARAALVNKEGSILKVHTHPIITWNPKPKYYQQSSDDIWNACCVVIKVYSFICLFFCIYLLFFQIKFFCNFRKLVKILIQNRLKVLGSMQLVHL